MPVSKDDFRRALGSFASGVTVVTLKAENGERFGITVSAFSSLSLEPPLVLICINQHAPIHEQLQPGAKFGVNILASHQENLSRQFATKGIDRFSGVSCRDGDCGTPLLDGCLAHLECEVVGQYSAGDHTVIIGSVESTAVS